MGPSYRHAFLHELDARGIADDWSARANVEASKRAPDLLQVALKKLDAPSDASKRDGR
jgi:hypothetical protein